MNEEVLKKIQKIEIEALFKIKEICEKNNIKFFLRGGSVLGAIKYNGFVPWDDDIDIALPRDDYNRFIQIMDESFDERFNFICYQKTSKAHCYFPRIILNEKAVAENQLPKNNERGLVLIDILPLDGMPDNQIKLKIHIIKAYIYRLLASVWTCEAKETISMHSSKKDALINFLYKIKFHKLYKQDTIYKKMDKLYEKYKYGFEKNAGMLASSKMKKEIMPYEWWGKGTQAFFEGNNVLVPTDYDNYLKKLFGDNYLTYEPALEERNKSHIIQTKGK